MSLNISPVLDIPDKDYTEFQGSKGQEDDSDYIVQASAFLRELKMKKPFVILDFL